MEITGTSDRILEIDLTKKDVKEIQVHEKDRKMYLGAKGLGLKLLYDRLKPGIDPLGDENYLAFMMGVFMGTGAPCSGRFAALTKSPLTGIMLASSCGGPFGMALKTAGFDGILVTGRAQDPVCLVIDAQEVHFEDASSLWGLDAEEAQTSLQKDKKRGILTIGPAGENRVSIANVRSGDRFLGRGGMGAVMGAKNLKAIVAKGGTYKILPKNPEKFEKAKKKATAFINRNNPSIAYRKFGTSSNVDWCNDGGILPVNNFQGGRHDAAGGVSGKTMQERYQTRHHTCTPCTILCGHRGTLEDGSVHAVPEYETVGLLGPNLGIYDPDLIVEWNDLCGRMGMDTISTGAVLGWVMEAGEKGLLDTPLRFGSPEGITQAIQDMAHGKGFGKEMGKGTRWLSEKYGGRDFAIQIKGLEMAAYDPRGSWGQGLSYAVANRGACHLSALTMALEVLFGFLNPYTARAKPRFVYFFENLYAAVNSLQTCQFTAFAYVLEPPIVKYTPKFMLAMTMQYMPAVAIMLMDVSLYAKLFSAVTGIRMCQWEMLKAGRRVHTLERLMNTREGIRRKDDTLPERFMKEGRSCDDEHQTVPLFDMLDDYYRLRGYDHRGIPSPKTLRKLGIEIEDSGRFLPERKDFRLVTPKGKPMKRLYLSIMLWFVGRAMQAASRVDKGVKKEFETIPNGFRFSLGVAPGGPAMVMEKTTRGRVKYVGSKPGGKPLDLSIKIKHLEAAILLFTFQESTATASARDRLVVEGELPMACAVVRILDMVEVLLLPKIIARLAVKRYPAWSPLRKHLGRFMVYVRAVVGF
ncbi:MAG: aldehyde ferredoxin oxidoreductase family protein [Deltaproteobacteria bacterium]|nr:aldehyde ferredoxin oxidoreductase family protein [Deltaproteobacteria bacterium]